MNQLDAYYRALVSYRQHTQQNRECSSLCTAIAEADTQNDKIVITRAFCTIDEDWVNAIEEGLRHVEKAIKQERQFIRSNGEVVEIEKVKHVSRESVEHLSKHSNLITRFEEEEDIIPDKLYTVERLSDYAVYENRFLYMLLCYLRDFITLRYNDILDLTNKYDATIEISKKVSVGKEKMTYSLSMHDVRSDDSYLKEHNPAKGIIDRIDLVLKAVFAYLSTPLMEEVAKSPMLKPPVTKTNVLKMDNDFKGAMALYSYIVSYDKPGYTVENKITDLAPFGRDLASELAEAGGLVSFLAYEYGLDLKQELKDNYAKEEDRRRAEEIAKRAERVAMLKRKLAGSGSSVDEYLIELEKRCRDLDGESARAAKLSEEMFAQVDANRRLAEEKKATEEEKRKLADEIDDMRIRHHEDMQRLRAEHEEAMMAAIARLEEQHKIEVDGLNETISSDRARHNEEMSNLRSETADKIADIRRQSDDAIKDARDKEQAAKLALEDEKNRIGNLVHERDFAQARLKANFGIDHDYTDRDSFNMLEREYKALKSIYDEQWSKTKKSIFKKHINKQNIDIKEIRSNKGKDEKSE